MTQPIQTLSKLHFNAYNQILDDYVKLQQFEQEMQAWEDFKQSQEYLKAKSVVKDTLLRIIANKHILMWDFRAEQEQLNQQQ